MNNAQKELEAICTTCITRALCENQFIEITKPGTEYYGSRMIAIATLMKKCSTFRDLIIEAVQEDKENGKTAMY